MDQKESNTPRRHKKKKNRVGSILKKAILLGILLILTGIFVVGCYLAVAGREWAQFDPDKLENINQTSFIYDYLDQPVTGIHGAENRIKISLNQVPVHVRNAFIAVEDVRFYQHQGFDIKRIIGAFIEDIKAGGYVQGASTITQQVIKNSHLTQEKKLSRKIQEVYLAYQMEQKYSKDQILMMYLNLIYFGKGAYGIEAASRLYFGKSAKDLSLAEGALLAGIPKNPSRYSPFNNLEESLKRKDLVLSLMLNHNFITEEEWKQAKEEKIQLAEVKEKKYQYGFFIDMVIQEAAEKLQMDEEDLYTKGYRIYTTLDPDLQDFCEKLFQNDDLFPKSPASNERSQAALVILDSATGELRAVMGGRSYETRKGLNRALQARRQPGSAIKPILVYSPALEDYGYTAATIIRDEPITIGDYSPSNSGGKFYGNVTLRNAVARSINIPAVKVLYDIGIKNGIGFAEKLGIPFADEDRNSLSIALGGFHEGVTPLELATAYTALADKGLYKGYTVIRRIEDPYGVPVYEHKVKKTQVMSEETAFLMSSILRSSVQWGTASSKLGPLQLPLAAKTGTVELPQNLGNIKGAKDAWIVAYNPDYIVAVWMGFDKTDASHYLPSDVFGGNYPAEIAKEIFKKISSQKKLQDFQKPDGITEAVLDLKALTDFGQIVLAGPLTPDEYKVTEYFKKGTEPKTESNYWVVPKTPTDFQVSMSSQGFPLITFLPLDTFGAYDIYRVEDGQEPAFVQRIQGANIEPISWTDTNVEYGKKYGYFIVPVNPDVLVGNAPLSGTPTATLYVQVLHPGSIEQNPEEDPFTGSPDSTQPSGPDQEDSTTTEETEEPTVHLELLD